MIERDFLQNVRVFIVFRYFCFLLKFEFIFQFSSAIKSPLHYYIEQEMMTNALLMGNKNIF